MVTVLKGLLSLVCSLKQPLLGISHIIQCVLRHNTILFEKNFVFMLFLLALFHVSLGKFNSQKAMKIMVFCKENVLSQISQMPNGFMCSLSIVINLDLILYL